MEAESSVRFKRDSEKPPKAPKRCAEEETFAVKRDVDRDGCECVGSVNNRLCKIEGKRGGKEIEREERESTVVGLLPRPRRAAALLSGRRGRGRMANSRPRGSGVASEVLRPTIKEQLMYSECQPHILPLIPALASHREESPQRRKENRESKNSR